MERRRRKIDSEATQPSVHVLTCVECGSRSGLHALGWRGYRIDEQGTDEPPSLAFFCPTCAAAIFDA